MKRMLVLFFLFLFCFNFAIAESEISFMGIKWLSDEETVKTSLREKGIIVSDNMPLLFSREGSKYIISDEITNYRSTAVLPDEDIIFSQSLNQFARGRIAGYAINNLVLSYAYDGQMKLISVKVELVNAEYNSLVNKLKKVYGEADKTVTEEGVESFIWKGVNNSAVLLYSESGGIDYTLMYGRLDAAEILSNCLTPADPDDVSGL